MGKITIDGLLKILFVQDKKYRWEFEEDIFVLSTEIINFLLRKHWWINKHKMHRKDVNVYTVCKINGIVNCWYLKTMWGIKDSVDV